MLILLRHGLAFLANPKTGTTATEQALRPYAEIVFARNRKHLTAHRFRAKVAPFLRETFGTDCGAVAVMRDPVDQIRSWYKYRRSPKLDGTDVSTAGMDFEDYVRAVISDDPPPAARIGSQQAFLCGPRGRLLVEHLFAYDQSARMQDFFAERMGTDITFKQINVSKKVAAPLSSETLAALRAARAAEFALYDRLRAAGGYLDSTRSD
jgi:hypothetical protein